MNIHVDVLTVGPFASNCFILANDAKQALVIDPGDEADQIIAHIRQRDYDVQALLVTHGHIDHVSGLADVHDAFPVPIAMHPVDIRWAFSEANQMPPYYGTPRRPASIERELAEGQTWTDMGLTYQIMELPGHAPGHVGFYFPEQGLIFSGDVLFQGSIGRSDLPGSDGPTLMQSLQRLSTLPDHTVVYCGHGPETTIGQEKQTNPFLAG